MTAGYCGQVMQHTLITNHVPAQTTFFYTGISHAFSVCVEIIYQLTMSHTNPIHCLLGSEDGRMVKIYPLHFSQCTFRNWSNANTSLKLSPQKKSADSVHLPCNYTVLKKPTPRHGWKFDHRCGVAKAIVLACQDITELNLRRRFTILYNTNVCTTAQVVSKVIMLIQVSICKLFTRYCEQEVLLNIFPSEIIDVAQRYIYKPCSLSIAIIYQRTLNLLLLQFQLLQISVIYRNYGLNDPNLCDLSALLQIFKCFAT